MNKKTIVAIGATALLGLSSLSVVEIPNVSTTNIVYAATTSTQKTALKKAKSYYKTMNMSKQGIYDQLTSDSGERFTPEEAQYAIDKAKLDYNKAALKKAKSYQDTMAMSPDAIYDQLTSDSGERFTAEEAQYAIDNLNS